MNHTCPSAGSEGGGRPGTQAVHPSEAWRAQGTSPSRALHAPSPASPRRAQARGQVGGRDQDPPTKSPQNIPGWSQHLGCTWTSRLPPGGPPSRPTPPAFLGPQRFGDTPSGPSSTHGKAEPQGRCEGADQGRPSRPAEDSAVPPGHGQLCPGARARCVPPDSTQLQRGPLGPCSHWAVAGGGHPGPPSAATRSAWSKRACLEDDLILGESSAGC